MPVSWILDAVSENRIQEYFHKDVVCPSTISLSLLFVQYQLYIPNPLVSFPFVEAARGGWAGIAPGFGKPSKDINVLILPNHPAPSCQNPNTFFLQSSPTILESSSPYIRSTPTPTFVPLRPSRPSISRHKHLIFKTRHHNSSRCTSQSPFP